MQELPPKKDVALFLLQRSSVFIHLDPRSDDVIVPAGFKREPRLVLQIGHNMAVPIPDLAIEDDGWSGTLSFRRVPFRCVVPWTSVFAMVGQDGQGMVWPDDVPPELAQPQRPAEPKVALAPAPAPEAEEAADADAKPNKSKAKRARKKTDKAEVSAPTPLPNAGPQAVPAAAAVEDSEGSEGGEAAEGAEGPEGAEGEAPQKPAPAGAPGQKPGKPKRELPPYLRVIK